MLLIYVGLGLIVLGHLMAMGTLVALSRHFGARSPGFRITALAEGLEILAVLLIGLASRRILPGEPVIAALCCYGGGIVLFLLALVVQLFQIRGKRESGPAALSILLVALFHFAGPAVLAYSILSNLHFSM